MLKVAFTIGLERALEESDASEMVKEAIRFKALHGTSGMWKKLIPRFRGALAGAMERNPIGVYAATKKRSVLPTIRKYINRAIEQRGGTPSMAKVVVDTEKGWMPSSYTESLRDKIRKMRGLSRMAKVTPRDQEDYIYDLIAAGDVKKKALRSLTGEAAIKAKRELGDIYKELHESVGTWYTPKEVKPIKWGIPK